jgi:hypothetical protein
MLQDNEYNNVTADANIVVPITYIIAPSTNIVVLNTNTVVLNTNTVDVKAKRVIKKRKAPAEADDVIVIPTFDNYNAFLNHKFNSIQLKSICRHYKLPVSGTKQVLTNTIYKHLYFSHYAIRIQRHWRKTYMKIYAKLHGPARFKRNLCVNETDFFTMDAVKDIPYKQFFSYLDSKDNMIYGFDIMSLHNLIEKNENTYKNDNNKKHSEVLNPYTRNPFSTKVKKDFQSLLFFADLLHDDIQLEINEIDDTKVTPSSIAINGYNIEQRAFNLFQDIDSLGNYTNPVWFMELRRHQILLYLKEFNDIWSYRAQLSDQIKHEICPQGNPFSTIHIGELAQIPFRELQHTILVLMETMVRGGINQNSRYLGSTYVLCALTLVNDTAAEALPWLYESVAVQF